MAILYLTGTKPTKKQVVRLLQRHGVSQPLSLDSGLSLAQFAQEVLPVLLRQDTQQKQLETFNLMDRGGKGYIDLADLVAACRATGVKLNMSLLKKIHAEADYDANEKVGYNEFCAATRERDT